MEAHKRVWSYDRPMQKGIAWLVLAIAISASGCFVEFDGDLLADGSASVDRTVKEAPAGEAVDIGADLRGDGTTAPDSLDPDALAPDTTVPDTTAPDVLAPDLPPTGCAAWSNWSCDKKNNNSVSRCPATGTQVYSLVCNASGCACTNVTTVASNNCSVSNGIECSDAQAALAAGCCNGI